MRKTPLLTALILAAAVSGLPQVATAMGGSSPSSTEGSSGNSQGSSKKPSGKSDTKKNKNDKSSSAKDFIDGYHAAYALIYDKNDFQGGIAALRALEHDNNADVATLLGYASRKLGRYDEAKYWYDKALAADPKHALTWSYYGMWHAEQGNLLKAKDDLEQVRLICGTECKEYVALKEVIDGTRTY
jgi:tetratricopeptide (TPR) repeat protein